MIFGKILFLTIACTVSISGCSIVQPEFKEKFHGRLLIWHPFEGKEAETLNIILDNYSNQ